MYAVSMHSTEVVESIHRAAERLPHEILRALERTAQLASTYAKTSTLYRSHTYGLRNSITWGAQLVGSTGASAAMRASAPYAHWIENGTKPHTIEPKRAQSLRFVQNGAIRFAKIVRHPGTKATHFMVQAQERATPLLERLMGEAVARAFT